MNELYSSELDNWSVVTRMCATLSQAMQFAQDFLLRTQHVFLWPMPKGEWMVIVKFPVLWN